MSAMHTPGPLKIAGRETRGLPHTLVASRTLLFRVYSEAYGDMDQEVANARRLVACWNVCDGMSTESLELMPGQFFKPPYQRLAELEAQRDELLDALLPFASVDLRTQGVHQRFADDVLRARAAIAAMKGGAA